MKTLKTKWKKNGEEIDAYVHISNIVISKDRLPTGRGGGGGGSFDAIPPDYGSLVEYYISEDKEGKVVISRGQAIDIFDFDDVSSVKDFAVGTLKRLPSLKDLVEE